MSRDDLNTLVVTGITVLVVVAAAMVLARAGHRVIGRLERRLLNQDRLAGRGISRSRTLAEVSRSVLNVVVWTFAVLEVLSLVEINVVPLIAGAGIAGVALGFGAQSLVRDFLTGFFVLLEDQYGVGDFVDIDGVKGSVERFTLRLTSIRAVDGTLHHISNGQIKIVGNSSAGWTKAIVDITVGYDEDVGRVEQALLRAAEELVDHPQVGPLVVGPAETLGVESLADGNVVVRVAIRTVPGSRMTVARAFRAKVKEVFRREGISVPVPHSILIQQAPPTTEPDVKA